MFDFSKRVVVINGAAGNLGVAVTRAFQKTGATLVLVDRGKDRLAQIYPDLVEASRCFFAIGVDLNDVAAVEQMASEAVRRFERIDALVNTAGGYRAGQPLAAITV